MMIASFDTRNLEMGPDFRKMMENLGMFIF